MNGFSLISELPITEIFKIDYNFEPGYILYNKLISIFTQNPYSIIVISTFLSLLSIYIFIYKYSKNPWLSVFIFSTIGGIFQMMTFLRQYLALSILLFTIPLIIKRKFLPFALLVCIASTFHKTSILFFLIYFLSCIKINAVFLTLYTVGLGGLFLVTDYIIPFVINRFYSNYLEMTQWLEETGGYKFLLMHGVILVFLLCLNRDKKIYHDIDPYFISKQKTVRPNMLYNIYISAEVILFAIFFTSLKLGLISRLMVTFEPIILVAIPEIIHRVYSKQLRIAITIISCFALILFSYILLKNTYIYNSHYKFIWQ